MALCFLTDIFVVRFTADLKANLSLKSDRGEIFSDFDVQVKASAPQQIVEDGRGHGGKYLVKIEKAVRATINGGGPELQFTNFNGGIYIHKAGAARRCLRASVSSNKRFRRPDLRRETRGKGRLHPHAWLTLRPDQIS